MNRIEKALLVFALFGLSCSVQAITPENRYETIIDRNIFRLNPPPAINSSATNEIVPDRKVDLSGISNVGGNKKAWFVVAPKAGSKDLPLYLNLSEGERQDFLEVVSIKEQEGEVKVVNAGNPMVLSLKNNSLKGPPVAPTPQVLAPPVANTIVPTPQPATASYGNSSYGGSGVTVTGGTPTTPPATGGQIVEGSGLRSIPTRTLRLAPVAAAAPEKPVDPLTQRVLMEVQQEHAKQTGQSLPPIPPLPQ
jgi:hypothetical protein